MVTMHSAVRTTGKTPEDRPRERLSDPKVFGLMRAVDDPDIQRTLQLGLRIARILGSRLHA